MRQTDNIKFSVWHDCDPGHDDAISILLEGQLSHVKTLGISTVAGNSKLNSCTQNALNVLNAIGRNDIDVIAGQDRPLLSHKFTVPQLCKDIHGDSGLNIEDDEDNVFPKGPKKALEGQAIWVMFDRIKKEYQQRYLGTDQKVKFIATGPLTNVALLLILYPEVVNYIEISIMGGCIAPGNFGPVQEYNIAQDPEATKYVFDSGVKITLVPLEVTHKAVATKEVLQNLMSPTKTEFKQQVEHLIMFFQSTYKKIFDMDYPPLHDPCATAYALDPSMFKTKLVRIDVDTISELTRGQLVMDFFEKSTKPKNIIWCEDIDLEKFWGLVKIALDNADKVSPLNKT